MAWTKLDDDTCVTDQPLSAFVGKRLTDNVNVYAAQLSRAATFTWPTNSVAVPEVKWASLESRGTVLTVDVGINALFYNFRILYKTTNAALGGTFIVQGIDDGVYVRKHVDGSATAVTVEIPFTFATPASGIRGFWVGWASDVGASQVGSVTVVGAVANQVFCEPYGSPAQFPFTTSVGSFTEMYHLLVLNPASGNPSPSGDALLRYQVCGFKYNDAVDQPPDGVLLVWPNIEVNPPILPTGTTGSPQYTSAIYELGRLELYSITIEIVAAETAELAPYPYQQPTPINTIANRIDAGMTSLQINAANNISSGGYLGCVLPANEDLTFAFFVQTDQSVQQLLVSFRAIAYTLYETVPNIKFSVVDCTNASVGVDITHTAMPVPRIAGQTEWGVVDPSKAVFMNGVLAGDQQWGMRDAMDLRNVQAGLPVRFTWGPNTVGDINQGTDGSTDAVYYCKISATADLYIYGFHCKVQ